MDATLKFTFEDGTEALAHYGVMGMRWGVRHDDKYKAKKAGIKSSIKAKVKSGQMTRKEGKASMRSQIDKAKVDTANRLYSGNSKEANRRIQTRSTAKTLGLSSLMGSYGTMQYDRSRAEGAGRGKSAVRGVLANATNNLSYGVYGLGDYANDRMARNQNMRSHNRTTNDYSFSGEGGQNDEIRARRLKKNLARRS